MAGRKQKLTVDYFPHFVNHGKTLFVIEQLHGNDGYAILFKTLEVLSSTDGHSYSISDPENWLYLCARCKTTPEIVKSVLDLMAKMGTIDAELYEKNVIWCDHLIENLSPVYEKRVSEKPKKPIPAPEIPISDTGNTQSKVKGSKGEKDIPDSDESGIDFYITKKGKKLNGKRFETFMQFWEAFNYKKGKAAAADAWLKIPELTKTLVEQIILAAKNEAALRSEVIEKGSTPKWPEGWITDKRWEDEYEAVPGEKKFVFTEEQEAHMEKLKNGNL